MKNIILALVRDKELAKKLTELELKDAELCIPDTEREILKMASDATVLFADPPIACKHINDAKNVQWMHSTFTGVDAMMDGDLRRNYVLTNTRGVYGKPIAEYVFAYALFLERKIEKHRMYQKRKQWRYELATTLGGRTIGVVGTGSIGKEIAKFAKFFSMHTVGLRTKKESVSNFDDIFVWERHEDFFSQSDYVISVLPSTSETKNIIDKNTFEHMKPSAFFMNVGRGDTVNESDLIDALTQKKIAGAVLDVFSQEPLPRENPLWNFPNVFVTPHIAGSVVNNEVIGLFKENYERFVMGKELKHQVDFEKGY